MTQTYKLRPEAEKDLENIWHYTVQKWGVEQAILYIEQLDETFQLLAENPLLSQKYKEFNPPVHIHHHKKHLIVYVIEQTDISIIRVLHETMDIEPKLNT